MDELSALRDRIAQLEGIQRNHEAARAHWRSEADRDAGKIARLERGERVSHNLAEEMAAEHKELQRLHAQALKQVASDKKKRGKAWRLVNAMKEACGWVYQFASAAGASVVALDNLSALSSGKDAPHEWPWPASSQILEFRVADWVTSRIGPEHMNRKERSMRLLEEAVELCQAEGISEELVGKQVEHVYFRPAGVPEQEAAGVAVCILGWCASAGVAFRDLAIQEIERIEAKPIEQIRGSLARKADADLVICVEDGFCDHVREENS